MSTPDYWTFFLGETQRLNAPLYVKIMEGVVGDPQLRALGERAKPGQPPANMLLGAVHFLLLRGAEHELKSFYPDLNGGTKIEDRDPFPAFRDFVRSHEDEIAPIIESRITNTNEVGRTAALHPGFRVLSAQSGEPLHLVEIGPSAGLNLIWDSYGVRYTRDGESFETPKAALTVEAVLRGEKIPPLGPAPRVASRMGLEKNPVNLNDPLSRDWLRALVWPDHPARGARLDKALEIFSHARPEIRTGDALDLLPEALAGAPRDETLCVYHTIVTYQFTHDAREALDNLLVAAGLRRPVWRLSLEFAGPNYHPLRLTRYEDGSKTTQELALCDAHGAWIEWLA